MNARTVKIQIADLMQQGREDEAAELLNKYSFFFGQVQGNERQVKKILTDIKKEVLGLDNVG